MIEIGSPGTRKSDETIKRRLYERMGVTEWVADPDLDAIRVYRRSAGGFDRPVGGEFLIVRSSIPKQLALR